MVGIEESFANLAYVTTEDRVATTHLMGANFILISQVEAYANNIFAQEANNSNLIKTTYNLQG